MAKRTLLQMVQDILFVMESDDVNSIGDTEESQGVAEIIRTTFFDLHSTRNWPDKKQLVQLVALSDLTKPTHMKIADDFTEMVSLNYDKAKVGETRKRYSVIKWKEPDDFLRLNNQLNNDESNVMLVTDPSGVELLVKTDKHPDYYTSFDDEHIVFDSYDSSVDSTLQASKVQAMAYVFPTFELEDGFVPELPIDGFSALQAEARSRCQYWFKDFRDAKSEQEAGRQQRRMARKSWRVKGGIRFPNYGRRGSKSSTDPTFKQGRS